MFLPLDCYSNHLWSHWSRIGYLRVLSILALTSLPLRAVEISSMDPESGYNPSSWLAELQLGWCLELWCNVDDYSEWCAFSHPSSNNFCDIQWKREPYNVTVNECNFEGSSEYLGNYDNYNCGIRIYHARIEDSREWRCDLEWSSTAGLRQ